MKFFLNIYNKVFAFIKKGFLFLLGKDPVIKYFSCYPLIAINNLPQFIKWKVKYSWKVEIEGIGKVKGRDCMILNNKELRSDLVLVVYGRKNKTIRRILDLNLKRISLQRIPNCSKIEFQFQHYSNVYHVNDLKEKIHGGVNRLFYDVQKNESLRQALNNIVAPRRINASTNNLEQITNGYSGHLLEYFNIHFNDELKKQLQIQNLKLWIPELHMAIPLEGQKAFQE